MYKPREDSYLLEKYSKKFSKGKVLDVGTGTGILAEAALKSAGTKQVTAVDIDIDAIDFCKKHCDKRIRFIKSDLFSNVRGKFDTIIFNPPYLPDEKKVKIIDPALYGGKHGWEIIERFFKSARDYLNEDGIILILFSSHTKKRKVDNIIKKAGFKFKQLDKIRAFFEDLFVYVCY